MTKPGWFFAIAAINAVNVVLLAALDASWWAVGTLSFIVGYSLSYGIGALRANHE